MHREFYDPPRKQINIVKVDEITIRRAQRRILSCEACNPDYAPFPFAYLLDEIVSSDPSITDYVLSGPARCPRCAAKVYQTTLVESPPRGSVGRLDTSFRPWFFRRNC